MENINYKKQVELLKELKNKNFNLDDIQKYIKEILNIRNLNRENELEEMLLLVEEVGELAKAIRKDKMNFPIDKQKNYTEDSIEEEVADIFIVFIGLCNKLDISLKDCFINKEEKNFKRVWGKQSDY